MTFGNPLGSTEVSLRRVKNGKVLDFVILLIPTSAFYKICPDVGNWSRGRIREGR